MDCIVKEATEIQLHPDNFNDMEFTPSWSQNPATNILWQSRAIEQWQKEGLTTANWTDCSG
jgi:hypothetical protein